MSSIVEDLQRLWDSLTPEEKEAWDKQFAPVSSFCEKCKELQAEVERLNGDVTSLEKDLGSLMDEYRSLRCDWRTNTDTILKLLAREQKWREYAKLIDNLDIESFATEPSDKDKQRMIQLRSELMEQGGEDEKE